MKKAFSFYLVNDKKTDNSMAPFSEKLANDIQEICGIDASELIRVGLLHPNEARKWIVKKK